MFVEGVAKTDIDADGVDAVVVVFVALPLVTAAMENGTAVSVLFSQRRRRGDPLIETVITRSALVIVWPALDEVCVCGGA